MEIRAIYPEEHEEALKLIWDTFLEFEAPDYSKQGVATFLNFISDVTIFEVVEFFVASENNELKGVIATRNNRSHVCCFFVSAKFQRQGIGGKLWEYLKNNSDSLVITVNSSPFAV